MDTTTHAYIISLRQEGPGGELSYEERYDSESHALFRYHLIAAGLRVADRSTPATRNAGTAYYVTSKLADFTHTHAGRVSFDEVFLLADRVLFVN